VTGSFSFEAGASGTSALREKSVSPVTRSRATAADSPGARRGVCSARASLPLMLGAVAPAVSGQAKSMQTATPAARLLQPTEQLCR
jgi:hypothetical protein